MFDDRRDLNKLDECQLRAWTILSQDLDRQLRIISELWSTLLAGYAAPAFRQRLRWRLLHLRLTFDIAECSEPGRLTDHLIEELTAFDDSLQRWAGGDIHSRVQELIEALRAKAISAVMAEPNSRSLARISGPDCHIAAVLSPRDPALRHQIEQVLLEGSFIPLLFDSATELAECESHLQPSVVIITDDNPDQHWNAVIKSPLIWLGYDRSITRRQHASNIGAWRFVSLPLKADELEHCLEILDTDDDLPSLRACIYTDNDHFLNHIKSEKPRHLILQASENHDDYFELIHTVRPDILILDQETTGASELQKLITSDPQWRHTPILVFGTLSSGSQAYSAKIELIDKSITGEDFRDLLRNKAIQLKSLHRLNHHNHDRDIEHYHTEMALNQHCILSITDPSGLIIGANAKFCEISGYAWDELIGQNHRIINSGLHDPEFFGNMWATIKRGQVWKGEICNRNKDGELYWVASTIVPFIGFDGQPYKYVSIRTDITERKTMELDARSLSRQLHQQLSSFHGLITRTAASEPLQEKSIHCLQQTLVSLNADQVGIIGVKLYGEEISNSLMIDRDPDTGATKTYQQLIDTEISDVLERCQLTDLYSVYNLKNDSGQYVFSRAFGLPESARSAIEIPIKLNNQLIGVAFIYSKKPRVWLENELLFASTISLYMTQVLYSERLKELAERLAESERRFKLSQRFANIGTWDWDILSGELFWSEQIPPLFGYHKHIPKTSYSAFLESIHPEDRQMVENAVNDCIQHGEIYNIEHRIVTDSGEIRWLHENGDVMRDSKGNPYRMLGVVRDVTNKKISEASIVEAKESAERANQAKSVFLSSMSHELRTPLNAIIGFSQLLLMDQDAKLANSQSECVDEIMTAGHHLLGLIDDVLDLAKIESGSLSLAMESIDLQNAAKEAARLIDTTLKKYNSSLELELNCESRCFIKGDKIRFRQILLNLLSNAAKYGHGKIILRCVTDKNDSVMISVADNGPGIPPSREDKLFKSFERFGHEASSTEGTGIGLVITKQLVNLMGGQIGYHHSAMGGSEFWITFKTLGLVETAPQNENPTSSNPSKQLRGKILYVEDNLSNARYVAAIMKKWPLIELTIAETPEKAINLAEHNLYDLLLLDIHLPNINGVELLARLRHLPKYAEIPAIAVTANSMKPDLEQYLRAGFLQCIIKPFTINHFINSIASALVSGQRRNIDKEIEDEL